MNIKDIKTKLTSRKFLVAVAGIISGIVLISGGNTNEGVATVVASVVAYLAAEGLIDMAAVKATAEKVEQAVDAADDEDHGAVGMTD